MRSSTTQEAGPRRVERHAGQPDRAARRRAAPRRPGTPPRTGLSARRSWGWRTAPPDPSTDGGMRGLVDADRHAELRQHALGVVAARSGLGHGRATVGTQAGEQHGALDLRRSRPGSRSRSGDSTVWPCTVTGSVPVRRSSNRAPMSSSGSVTRRIGRLESDSSPVSATSIGQPGEHAHEQPRRGAAVAAVDRRAVGARPERSPARTMPASVPSPATSSSTCAPSSRTASMVERTSAESSTPTRCGRALGHRREQHGAVRERLVAGQVHLADERAARRAELAQLLIDASPLSSSGRSRGSYPLPCRSAMSAEKSPSSVSTRTSTARVLALVVDVDALDVAAGARRRPR